MRGWQAQFRSCCGRGEDKGWCKASPCLSNLKTCINILSLDMKTTSTNDRTHNKIPSIIGYELKNPGRGQVVYRWQQYNDDDADKPVSILEEDSNKIRVMNEMYKRTSIKKIMQSRVDEGVPGNTNYRVSIITETPGIYEIYDEIGMVSQIIISLSNVEKQIDGPSVHPRVLVGGDPPPRLEFAKKLASTGAEAEHLCERKTFPGSVLIFQDKNDLCADYGSEFGVVCKYRQNPGNVYTGGKCVLK
jgi:hypothetical protein